MGFGIDLSRLSFVPLLMVGCAAGSMGQAQAPTLPSELARCKVAASHENPLVTEWPSSEKANLEGRLRSGAVAVAYSGCSMELLPACRLAGKYEWRRTTISTDTVEIQSADELFTKLPLGAASLEGELERSGRLAVQTTVSGQLELTGFDLSAAQRDPMCQGATHVVNALSIGSFKLRSGGGFAAKGGVGIVGAGTSSSEAVMREAGDPESCRQASDEAPNRDCSSPIQVFLRPLQQKLVEQTPPGMVKVRFLPPDSDRKWDLIVGDRVMCKVPCDRWTDPAMPYAMRTDGGFLRPDPIEEVPDLREFKAQAPLEVRTHPRDTADTVWGILMTSFGGIGMATGTVLLASGCGGPSSGRCTGGAITLPVGSLLVATGVWFIVKSHSYMEVVPMGAPDSWKPPVEQ